jgi:AhpD family alkylhydroperoxidase
MDDMNELMNEIETNLETLSEKTPDEMGAFNEFIEKIETKGALNKKQKELIAVALAVAAHCEWCISYHVKNALEEGASEQEILEAAWVAVLMGGGPALMYAQLVMKALEDFK